MIIIFLASKELTEKSSKFTAGTRFSDTASGRTGTPKVSTEVDMDCPDQIVSQASRYPSRHMQLDPIGQQPKTASLGHFSHR